jgi:hypothetical protein
MPNATAKRENKPSATRWPADEYSVEDEVELDFDAVELEEFDEAAVATAPTPLDTGPLSEI